MCLDPERSADAWLTLGASRLTFHAESLIDIAKFFSGIRKKYGDVSAAFGLALHIESDLSLIEPHLEQVEYIQFMGIASIGKQGQAFDRRVLQMIRAFRLRHPEMPIQVDGGVSLATARELVALEVSNLVVGSALLRAANPAEEIQKFESLLSPYGV
jgi:ribulose-phosphate 3-epimerase